MTTVDLIFKEAQTLAPHEKAELIDRLLACLDKPDKEIDELWAEEAEARIDAYERGEIETFSLDEVFREYRQGL